MPKRYKTFAIQYSQFFDTHDDEGNLCIPDKNFFKDELDAQKTTKWLAWRKQKIDTILETDFDLSKKDLPADIKQGKYIGILHDKDTRVNEDTHKTEPKPPHIHIVVMMKHAMTINAALDFFSPSRPENLSNVNSKAGALKYLCHVTEQSIADGKHIYSEDELFSNLPNDLKNDFYHLEIKKGLKNSMQSTSPEKKAAEKFTNLLGTQVRHNKLSMLEAEKTFETHFKGKSTAVWPSAKKQLETAFLDYLTEKANDFRLNGRNLTTVFITGHGGSGKTSLAEALAYYGDKQHRWHAATAPGKKKTTDFAEGYSGEPQSIINEVDGKMESFRLWCSFLDPHSYAPVSSRNHNINFLADKIYMTTSDTVSEWLLSAICQDEPLHEIEYKLKRKKFKSYELAQLAYLPQKTLDKLENEILTTDSNLDLRYALEILSRNSIQLLRRLKYVIHVYEPGSYNKQTIFSSADPIDTTYRIDDFTLEQKISDSLSLSDVDTYLDDLTSKNFKDKYLRQSVNVEFLEPDYQYGTARYMVGNSKENRKIQKNNYEIEKSYIFTDNNIFSFRQQTIIELRKYNENYYRHIPICAFGILDITDKKEVKKVAKKIDKIMGIYDEKQDEE